MIYNIQGGNNASLGLNKQTYNMARLKVKQISDFTSAVNQLIAGQGSDLTALQNSVDSLESIDSLISAELAAEILATGNEVTALQAVDSTQSTDIAANASDIAANDGDITALQNSVDSLESIDSLISAELAAEILATNNDVTALQAVDSTQSTAIAAILDGASTDLDQFAEVVAYVNSVSSTGDLDLTSFIATSNANDSTHSTAIVGLLGDVAALEAVDSTQSSAIAANAGAITSNDGDIKELQELMSANDLDNVTLHTESSVQSTAIAANLSAIGVINGSVDSLESIDSLLSAEIAALEGVVAAGDKMLHEVGSFVSLTAFEIGAAVKVGANDDVNVHINGHNIKKAVSAGIESKGYANGWSSTDGLTFQFWNIGYDLEASDVFAVQAIEA